MGQLATVGLCVSWRCAYGSIASSCGNPRQHAPQPTDPIDDVGQRAFVSWRMQDQAFVCELRSHSSKPMRPRRASPSGTSERSSTRLWVLSPASYNGKVGLAILCPITSQVKGYPFVVATPAGSRIGGVILADQVKSLDWRVRHAEFICKLPRETTVEVLEKLGALLFDAT